MEITYKITFTTPESHCDLIKKSLFAAGAGTIGSYTCCAYQSKVIGQFKPSAHSQPYQGHANQLEYHEEIKVELVCQAQYLKQAITALKKAHPYETPAVEIFKIETLNI